MYPSYKYSWIESISTGYDIHLSKTCPKYKGTRFNHKILQFLFNEKNTNYILKMGVKETISFFEDVNINLSVLNKFKKV